MSLTTSTHSTLKQSAAAERKKIRKERFAQLRKNKAFIVGAAILKDLPPFSWSYTETVKVAPRRVAAPAS